MNAKINTNNNFTSRDVTVCLINFFMSKIGLGTLNLNGARDSKKRAMLYDLIKQRKIDVMLVQETHSDVFNENDWLMEWDGLVVLSHKNHCSGGLAVL